MYHYIIVYQLDIPDKIGTATKFKVMIRMVIISLKLKASNHFHEIKNILACFQNENKWPKILTVLGKSC